MFKNTVAAAIEEHAQYRPETIWRRLSWAFSHAVGSEAREGLWLPSLVGGKVGIGLYLVFAPLMSLLYGDHRFVSVQWAMTFAGAGILLYSPLWTLRILARYLWVAIADPHNHRFGSYGYAYERLAYKVKYAARREIIAMRLDPVDRVYFLTAIDNPENGDHACRIEEILREAKEVLEKCYGTAA